MKYLRTLRERYRYKRKMRAWEDSPRRAELDAERDLPPRPLTEEEETLLRSILEEGTDFARSFLPQLVGIKAIRSCDCGCPSIRLVVDKDVPLGRIEPGRIVSDLVGTTAKGELTGLMLFQTGGRLTELEVYSLDGQILDDGSEFGLPTTESLHEFRTES